MAPSPGWAVTLRFYAGHHASEAIGIKLVREAILEYMFE